MKDGRKDVEEGSKGREEGEGRNEGRNEGSEVWSEGRMWGKEL